MRLPGILSRTGPRPQETMVRTRDASEELATAILLDRSTLIGQVRAKLAEAEALLRDYWYSFLFLLDCCFSVVVQIQLQQDSGKSHGYGWW